MSIDQGSRSTSWQRVLITGGAGFVGSHLADALVERGCRVTVIDDLSTGRFENIQRLVEKAAAGQSRGVVPLRHRDHQQSGGPGSPGQ